MVHLNLLQLCCSRIRVPVESQTVASHCVWFYSDISQETEGFSTAHDLLADRPIFCFSFSFSFFSRQKLHHVLWEHQGYCLARVV